MALRIGKKIIRLLRHRIEAEIEIRFENCVVGDTGRRGIVARGRRGCRGASLRHSGRRHSNRLRQACGRCGCCC